MAAILAVVTACAPAPAASTSVESAATASGSAAPPAASEAAEQITLKVWDQATDGGRREASQAIYQAFMDAHPNIKIEAESYDWNSLSQLAKNALASGTGPDVLYYDAGAGTAGLLAENDLILPLTQYAEQYGWTERIPEAIRNLTTFDGQLFGLGLETEFNAITANAGLIAEAGLTIPETYDQLLTFCKDAVAKGYIPLAYGQNPAIIAKDMFAMTATNLLGPDKIAPLVFDRQGRWDTPEMERSIALFFDEMVKAGCFQEGVNGTSLDNAIALFFAKKALMLPGGSFFNSDVDSNLAGEDLRLIPFPSIEGGVGRYYPVGLGGAWLVSSSAKAPDAAAEFIDYLLSDEAAKSWVEKGSIIPPVAFDVEGTTASSLTKQAAAVLAGPDLGYYIWPAWSNTLNFDVFQNGAQAVVAGQKSPSDLVTEMQAQWETDTAQ